MFFIQTFYLLCVIDLFYFYNVSDFIGYHDISLTPVDWNSENFTLIHRNEYINIPFSLLDTDIGHVLRAKIFYAGREKNLLAFDSEEQYFLKIIDLQSMTLMSTINTSSSKDTFTYAPQVDSENLWKFQTFKDSEPNSRVLRMIGSIDLRGQTIHAPVQYQLDAFRTWQRISLFEWNKFIFVAFRFSDVFTVMLRIQPIPENRSLEIKLQDLVAAFSPRLGPNEYIGFLPLPNDPILFTSSPSSPNRILFLSQPLSFYTKQIEIAKEECSKGEATDGFIDLKALIEETREDEKCEKDKIFFVRSTNMRECWVEDSVINYPIKVFSLNHEFEKKRIILASKKDLLCRYDIEGCPPPRPLYIQNMVHQQVNPINKTTIDTKKGLIVLVIKTSKNGTHFEKRLIPMFNCTDFTSCPSCVMLGYGRNCSWDSWSSKCSEYSSKLVSKPDSNVCFDPFIAKSYSFSDDSLKLVITWRYSLKLEYNEKVYVVMDEVRYDNVKCYRTHYEVIVKKSKVEAASIHVYRSTGGEMIIPGGKTVFFWTLAGFFFLFLLVLCLLMFLIKTQQVRRSSLGSPKTMGAQAMISTASDSSRKNEEPPPILPRSESSESPETPESPDAATFSELKVKRIRSSDSEGQFPREVHSEH